MNQPNRKGWGRVVAEYPALDPMERVAAYTEQCREYKQAYMKTPRVGEVNNMHTYVIDEQYSVMYLPVSHPRSSSLIGDDDQTFEIDIKCTPIRENQRQCLVIPINEEKRRSLTDHCVCLECVAASVRRAEIEEQETVRYVLGDLTDSAHTTINNLLPNDRKAAQPRIWECNV